MSSKWIKFGITILFAFLFFLFVVVSYAQEATPVPDAPQGGMMDGMGTMGDTGMMGGTGTTGCMGMMHGMGMMGHMGMMHGMGGMHGMMGQNAMPGMQTPEDTACAAQKQAAMQGLMSAMHAVMMADCPLGSTEAQ